MTAPDRSRLNDFCSKGLIRRYRNKIVLDGQFQRPKVDGKDLEELRIRWALSGTVGRLASHVLEYPREARSSIDYQERRNHGEITGAIDARATVIEQELTTDPTVFIVVEPSTSYVNGPNHLIAWTLREAEDAILSLLRREKIEQLEWVHERATLLDSALRNHVLHEVASSGAGKTRPGLAARRTAARSRATIYRLALEAFEAYEGIEALDEKTLRTILGETLLAPLEDWQMLELSAALAVSEALAEASKTEPVIQIGVGQDRMVATAGPYSVIWQKVLPQRDVENLDPSEALAKELALSIGPDIASSRVDVCIVHSASGRELAHVECKWYESEQSAAGAVADAAMQITRYARDSRPASIQEAKKMLVDSLIVVASKGKYQEQIDGTGPVGFTDFTGIESGNLKIWAGSFVGKHGT